MTGTHITCVLLLIPPEFQKQVSCSPSSQKLVYDDLLLRGRRNNIEGRGLTGEVLSIGYYVAVARTFTNFRAYNTILVSQ